MKNLEKYSFTLLELIVAIIIVSIAMTAIPALLGRVASTQEVSIQEKSFFSAYSLVVLLQMQEWDENNTKGNNYYKVLSAENGDDELLCENGTPRTGVSELDNDSGAICAEGNTTSHIGVDPDGNETDGDESTYDDIDDFNGYSTIAGDVNISVGVRYIKDETDYSKKHIFFTDETKDTITDTNMKFVELNITDKNTHKLLSALKYTTSNIGAVKIESRNE